MMIIEGTAVGGSGQLEVPKAVLYNWKAKHLKAIGSVVPEGAPSPESMFLELSALRKKSKSLYEYHPILIRAL